MEEKEKEEFRKIKDLISSLKDELEEKVFPSIQEIKQIKTNYDKTLKQVEIVQKSMETLKTIGSIGMNIIGFLGEGDKTA